MNMHVNKQDIFYAVAADMCRNTDDIDARRYPRRVLFNRLLDWDDIGSHVELLVTQSHGAWKQGELFYMRRNKVLKIYTP